MIILCLFLLANVLGNQKLTGPTEVNQCAGKCLNVVCQYHSFYKHYVKYWCRGYYFNYCITLIRTDQSKYMPDLLEIIDNKKEGFFTIHMRNVQTEDSGWYWCGIERVSRHEAWAMELIISAVKNPQCFEFETTTHEETTLATIQPTTRKITSATTLLQTSLETFSSHSMEAEIPLQKNNSIEILAFKIWMITRWILFIAMILFLFIFKACVDLWFRRS